MKKPYQLSSLFPLIDVACFSFPNPDSKLQDLYEKSLWLSSDTREIQERLQSAKIVFVHPDVIEKWKDIFINLSNKIPVSLFVFADSDLTLGHEHLDPWISAFPSAQFWVQNWFGYHESVKFLPIGVNGSCSSQKERVKSLGISFFLHYPGYIHREEFTQFLQESKWAHAYCFPFVPYETYCRYLSECFFSCCPMGGGYDTLRFWECLMMKTIPIVKSHVFYDALRLQYPKLPFLTVDKWEDIETLLPQLTSSYYEKILEGADFSPCFEEYWLNTLNT